MSHKYFKNEKITMGWFSHFLCGILITYIIVYIVYSIVLCAINLLTQIFINKDSYNLSAAKNTIIVLYTYIL